MDETSHNLEDTAELVTALDWVRFAASRIAEAGVHLGHGTADPVDEATELVLATLHLEPGLPDALFHARLTATERAAIAARLRRRIEERIPLPYITGRARFAGLDFHVDDRVLVPRSPIAELVQQGFTPWLDPDAVERVLDLCTGSGCIGIACAYAFPAARVDLSDVSEEALEVARINIRRHGLDARVAAHAADVFDGLTEEPHRYDLIVSNPPYVDAAEMARMPDEYRAEPGLGLAAGEDGLDVVRRILAGAAERLHEEGVLVVEVGASAGALEQAYPEVPFTWLEFEHGGEGVFLLEAATLREHEALFRSRAGEAA